MTIHMADGTVHETEFDMSLSRVEAPLKITVSKYDDGPTDEQRFKDAFDPLAMEKPNYNNLKGTENTMERQLEINGPNEIGNPELFSTVKPQDIADKFGRGSDMEGHYPPKTEDFDPFLPENRAKFKMTYEEPDERNYQNWLDKQSKVLGRDLRKDDEDYDMRMYWTMKHRGMPPRDLKPDDHFPDRYKYPNHPTFSDESMYHNPKLGIEGGKWEKQDDGSYSFTPGKSNFKYRDIQQLREYFDKYEKGNKLILPGSSLAGKKYAQANTGSITDVGVSEFHNSLAMSEQSKPDLAERGSLEREAQNAYRREIRRSPADGTFRATQEMVNDWERFRLPTEYNDNRSHAAAMRDHHDQSRMRDYDPFRQVPYEGTPGFDSSIPEGYNDPEQRRAMRTIPQNGLVNFTTKGGKEGIVDYTYIPEQKTIHVNWMGTDTYSKNAKAGTAITPMELGMDRVQKILTAMAEAHPEAEKFSYYRISGAREKMGNPGATDRLIERNIPRDTAMVPSSTKMPGLPKPGLGGSPGMSITDLY